MGFFCHTTLHASLPISLLPSSSSASPAQVAVVLAVLALLSPPRVVQGFGVCRTSFRCLNNGVVRYHQSIFGPCRCRCPAGYTGPRCQYRRASRKRSSALSNLSDFLQARLRAERRQLDLEQQLQQQQAQFDDGNRLSSSNNDHNHNHHHRHHNRNYYDDDNVRVHPRFSRR